MRVSGYTHTVAVTFYCITLPTSVITVFVVHYNQVKEPIAVNIQVAITIQNAICIQASNQAITVIKIVVFTILIFSFMEDDWLYVASDLQIGEDLSIWMWSGSHFRMSCSRIELNKQSQDTLRQIVCTNVQALRSNIRIIRTCSWSVMNQNASCR